MGLSSSQARLLTLTTRMHQIEYKAAKLEAQKLQMANESAKVYEEYLDALEATKVQVKFLNTDGTANYKDIRNYDTDFIAAGYALQFNGQVYDNSTVPETYSVETDDGIVIAYKDNGRYYSDTACTIEITPKPGTTPEKIADATTLSFEQLCKDAFGATSAPSAEDVEKVITNLINSGFVTIVATDRNEEKYETSVATNTGLREIPDEIDLKKAEAKYEADMKRIDVKDRKFDSELAAIETERNAIKQEMETLKTVAKDNVERTFKLFS